MNQKLGIIDADLLDKGTLHPNLALMKISSFYKQQNDNVELLESYDHLEDYDCVFISKVFSFTKTPKEILHLENIVCGGTGFYPDGDDPGLPGEIEHAKPDYDLYLPYVKKKIATGEKRSKYADYLDFSIGFTTRGCFRKCPFCVNRKYDQAVKHSPVTEFLDETRPKIYLHDDNFLAYPGWSEILDELIATGKPFQFKQGLDIRLMTREKAIKLNKVKYHSDFIVAFDSIKDREIIEEKIKLWQTYTSKRAEFYVLTAYESQGAKDIENTLERIHILFKHGCLPYLMRYEAYEKSKYRGLYIQLARWCNQPAIVKRLSFREFCYASQKELKHQDRIGSCLAALLAFEKDHPDIAARYFDMRYKERDD